MSEIDLEQRPAKLDDLETPYVIVDLVALQRNIGEMAMRAENAGVSLRPMFKTHKSAHVVALQSRAGARGVLVATLAEAEAVGLLGVEDVVLAYPPIGSGKLDRLRALALRTRLTVSVDSLPAVRTASRASDLLPEPLQVLIIVDSGSRRLGVQPQDVLPIAHEIADHANLRLEGVATHAGHVYGCRDRAEVPAIAKQEADAVLEAASILQASGYRCETVAIGSTPTAGIGATISGVTEIRPGNYVFNDAIQLALGVCEAEACALFVHATVISTPAPGRAVIDAGSKVLSSDRGAHGTELVRGFGRIQDRPTAHLERLSEEVAVVVHADDVTFAVGDRISIIPNHACTAVNLASTLWGVRANEVEMELPVLARR